MSCVCIIKQGKVCNTLTRTLVFCYMIKLCRSLFPIIYAEILDEVSLPPFLVLLNECQLLGSVGEKILFH